MKNIDYRGRFIDYCLLVFLYHDDCIWYMEFRNYYRILEFTEFRNYFCVIVIKCFIYI